MIEMKLKFRIGLFPLMPISNYTSTVYSFTMTISFKLHQLVSQLFVYGGDFDTKDGTGCRDYIHIMDIAKGHVAALKQIVDPTFHGVKIYNLGTGNGVTVLEIVKTFERVTGENIF